MLLCPWVERGFLEFNIWISSSVIYTGAVGVGVGLGVGLLGKLKELAKSGLWGVSLVGWVGVKRIDFDC